MTRRQPSPKAILGALRRIAAAVRSNDWAGYNAAVAAAKAIGCTPDQIEDAYRYPRSVMHHGPSFDIYGRII
ncbi:hypothetical protein [Rhodococcoides fascians]|uniref:hypothetical protein n=1 Tax=Rhodococcoides fascians TaxID=1828 RepID=UPI0005680402|nr:hypothetical protein [Rhodococcus fascians]